jgi:hypothetical protein
MEVILKLYDYKSGKMTIIKDNKSAKVVGLTMEANAKILQYLTDLLLTKETPYGDPLALDQSNLN